MKARKKGMDPRVICFMSPSFNIVYKHFKGKSLLVAVR